MEAAGGEMRLPCWLVGHRREREYRFIRRLDGYPLAIYRSCKACGKRVGLHYGRSGRPAPPLGGGGYDGNPYAKGA